MTTREKHTYPFDLFKHISSNGFDYVVSEKVVAIVNRIASKVGAPTYIKTPIFRKRVYDNKKRKHKNTKEMTDEEWELIRSFETGKIVKNEDGIHKVINHVYGYLNKLTDKNYEQMRNDIIEKITEIIDVASNEDLLQVGSHIFEIGAANRFYSGLYARLFKELVATFSSFHEIFDKSYKNFTQIFDNVEVVSNEDYDKFCLVNKKNDMRRSMVAFVVNLMKNEMVPVCEILSFMEHFVQLFKVHMIMEDNKPICEEISEILLIMLQLGIDEFSTMDAFTDVWKQIVSLSNTKVKKYPSFSNKSLFKFMDIVDELENKVTS